MIQINGKCKNSVKRKKKKTNFIPSNLGWVCHYQNRDNLSGSYGFPEIPEVLNR